MSITAKNLTKKFGHNLVVRGVSFEVKNGEFVTLLGPSGSGKSTVLRMIAGLEVPNSGEIIINGEVVTTISVQERNVGFVFQHYALFRTMTVLENVAFGLRIRGKSKEERESRARELLRLVGLDDLEHRMPQQLSGGQRQRVALARALAPEPSLLLLDEPFGALDTRLRKELRQWLRNLHDQVGLTTLLVTHDQEEAFDLSDRIVVMNKGMIEQEGLPRDIFEIPKTEFVASFVGETNRVEGLVAEGMLAWGPFRFKALHLKEGEKARALFRPTDVYVTRYREKGGWPGTITGLRYMGTMEAIDIELDTNLKMTAHIPRGVASLSDFKAGETVYVQVPLAHVYGA